LDRYAVVGNPISHSKSPLIHKMFAEQTGQNLSYDKIEGGRDTFEQEVSKFFEAEENKGLNVTVPFKERAFAMCELLTDRAQAAEAVNTLYLKGRKLVGDNTDGCGLVTDIQDNYGFSLEGKRILLIGAGGASKGVILPILEARPEQLVLSNRTFSKAQELVEKFDRKDFQASSFEALNAPFDLVINGTSASLSGNLPEISPTIFSSKTWVYDMMYGSEMTVFNRWAHESGAATVMDGLGMLVEQAAEAFFIWRGVRPDTGLVLQSLRNNT